jgi:hypothetical protein
MHGNGNRFDFVLRVGNCVTTSSRMATSIHYGFQLSASTFKQQDCE